MKKIAIIIIFGVLSYASLAYGQVASNNITSLLSSEGKILYGDEPNSIVVIDYPGNIDQISEYLKTVDNPPSQVLIEARVVEVKLQKEHSLGITWEAFAKGVNNGIPGLDLRRSLGITASKVFGSAVNTSISQAIPYKTTYYPPGQTVSGAENPFTVTIFDENINVVLKALANELDTNILSAPSVTTVNNRQAEIKVIKRLPWAEPSVSTDADTGDVTVTWAINFEEVGINLNVTPTIDSENKNIIMTLVPEVSEKIADYNLNVTSGGTSVPYTVPIIDKRTASTRVVIGDGQTLIIGGLIKDTSYKGETKIPFLGDLPYLGYLFKSKKDVKEKTELLIFVSPRIINQDSYSYMAKKEKYGSGRVFAEDRLRQERIMSVLEIKAKEKERKSTVNIESLQKAQESIISDRKKLEAQIINEENVISVLEDEKKAVIQKKQELERTKVR